MIRFFYFQKKFWKSIPFILCLILFGQKAFFEINASNKT
ncbi:Uncharacterised protein [Proteus penneri]|nr:Uncharacterised protein [Proteus penneri]